jgi:hypothetical protein
LWLLTATAAGVLLIACANIANLLWFAGRASAGDGRPARARSGGS